MKSKELKEELYELAYQIESSGNYMVNQIAEGVLVEDIKDELERVEKLVIEAKRIIVEMGKK